MVYRRVKYQANVNHQSRGANDPDLITVLQGELYTKQTLAEGEKGQCVDVTKNGPISGIGIQQPIVSELFRGAQLGTFDADEENIGMAPGRQNLKLPRTVQRPQVTKRLPYLSYV
ncbi:hypothetical protein N0V85_005995 [Neurospora sp. IMI 360204]|nr:hypothetical protein N0V85_005995 [Neurospora sp. IMI 360204]